MATVKTAKQNQSAEQEEEKTIVSKPIVPKDVDPNQYITVRNGFQGRLIYISKKTGETFEWDGFGEEQEMELRELKAAKNSYNKAFYSNNWFMFNPEDEWVIDYLGVRQYYKNAVNVDEFDDMFATIVGGIDQGLIVFGAKKTNGAGVFSAKGYRKTL